MFTVKNSKCGYFSCYLQFNSAERGVPLILYINTVTYVTYDFYLIINVATFFYIS